MLSPTGLRSTPGCLGSTREMISPMAIIFEGHGLAAIFRLFDKKGREADCRARQACAFCCRRTLRAVGTLFALSLNLMLIGGVILAG
jgi:hypothetical protein